MKEIIYGKSRNKCYLLFQESNSSMMQEIVFKTTLQVLLVLKTVRCSIKTVTEQLCEDSLPSQGAKISQLFSDTNNTPNAGNVSWKALGDIAQITKLLQSTTERLSANSKYVSKEVASLDPRKLGIYWILMSRRAH